MEQNLQVVWKKGSNSKGRLAQLVRAPALQALSPLLFSPSVTFNSLLYQQLGEPARRSCSKASIAKILDVSRSALYHFIETRKIDPA